MWGHIDGAQKDQALVDEGEMPKPKEKKTGVIWSRHGMIWFLEQGAIDKQYVGALRTKRKTVTPDIYKRLMRGDRIIMQYDAEDKAEDK